MSNLSNEKSITQPNETAESNLNDLSSRQRFLAANRLKLFAIAVVAFLALSGSFAYFTLSNPKGKNSQQRAVEMQNEDSGDKQSEEQKQADQNQSGSAATSSTTLSPPPTSMTSSGGSSGGTTSPSPPPSPSPAPPSGGSTSSSKTYTMSYTDSCYSPSSITIKAGDTIKFVNNSSRSMWPASDNHPSHNIYSEFDANTDISPGGNYSFTFSKKGSWGYHDHLKPGCTGIVTVQ